MNLLAFDTSTEVLSIALCKGEQMFAFHERVGIRASELILPEIQSLLNQAGLELNELDGIAYGTGPGAFTGLRIACGVAQGLAFGASLPVVGINSLYALAQASAAQKIIVCQDARMGEIYFAALERQQEGWCELSVTALYKPDSLPEIAGQGWMGVGSGWATYGDALQAKYHAILQGTDAAASPDAKAILQLAMPLFESGKTESASNTKPLYIRNRVALTTLEREQGQKL
ncbi:MAG TPA: tRNA (adenosine(37)-N6)-threonylcarbamoyltransferase complex dimerization subunit type 1 TsaB [Methylophilus sp.]|nr:tRNA (adenosine(37)-N6)-threonylcarbamoyltransferase complex dimerization subunit type 1 TsaB [Methylophilus sp.]HQQ32699.1 tRNA (adenosine(37)-N6)-threonylcarbamoyltransferase complex dimerization subunit type 1 TsaB [Methylophilus sp.]